MELGHLQHLASTVYCEMTDWLTWIDVPSTTTDFWYVNGKYAIIDHKGGSYIMYLDYTIAKQSYVLKQKALLCVVTTTVDVH